MRKTWQHILRPYYVLSVRDTKEGKNTVLKEPTLYGEPEQREGSKIKREQERRAAGSKSSAETQREPREPSRGDEKRKHSRHKEQPMKTFGNWEMECVV